jgi:hypothetical protein
MIEVLVSTATQVPNKPSNKPYQKDYCKDVHVHCLHVYRRLKQRSVHQMKKIKNKADAIVVSY